MATKEKSLNDLFHDTLKDIYFAEKQIVKALPKMAKAAASPDLKKAFETHLEETRGQIDRLEQVFGVLGKKPQGKTCEAIKGLLEEGKEIMEEFKDTEALDAGLVSSAQAVEHYEMARYGTLSAWASQLGMSKAVKLLEETLTQEKSADKLLSKIASSGANRAAA